MTPPPGFKTIIGQQHPINLLKAFIRNGTLPHALLFTGDDGIGKKTTATAFAMACNCLTLKSAICHHTHVDAIDACGDCTSCRKIAGNHHPDVIHVRPISSVIRIAQIRGLLQILSLKPNEADHRIVILSEAQAMNPEAGNALLKVLEEPPDRTLLILTARQTSELLPTVVSRCRHIRFHPLSKSDIKGMLTATGACESNSADVVASICGGSCTRAQRMADIRWLNRRNWVIRAVGTRITKKEPQELRAWLAFSEMLANKKDLVEESLEIVTMWLRDILVVPYDPQKVHNQDRLKEIEEAAAQTEQQQLLDQIDAVDCALKALGANTNARLTLDAMVLRMFMAGNGYT